MGEPMSATLSQEIDAIAADRMRVEREQPGLFWDDEDGGRKLTREEAGVFGIKYDEFPRMITVWEAWFAFLGHVEAEVFGTATTAWRRDASIRSWRPAMNRIFTQFATKIGGLSQRQAEAMYWKDWFWTVREGHIRYEDEPAHP